MIRLHSDVITVTRLILGSTVMCTNGNCDENLRRVGRDASTNDKSESVVSVAFTAD